MPPTVKSCQLVSGGRSGRWTNEEREYIQVWRVVMSDAVLGPISALLSPNFTISVTTYTSFDEYDTYSYLSELDAREESRLTWLVTAKYTTKIDPLQKIEDPLLRKRKVRWSKGIYTKPVSKDRDGKPILNSAGDPFMPQFQEEIPTVVMRYTRNEPTFDVLTFRQYINKLNNSSFLGADAYTVLLSDIECEEATERGVTFYTITYTFEHRESGWDDEILDCGMYEKKDGKYQPIMRGNVPVSHPVPLRSGIALPVGETPEYLKFKIKKGADFSALAIT